MKIVIPQWDSTLVWSSFTIHVHEYRFIRDHFVKIKTCTQYITPLWYLFEGFQEQLLVWLTKIPWIVPYVLQEIHLTWPSKLGLLQHHLSYCLWKTIYISGLKNSGDTGKQAQLHTVIWLLTHVPSFFNASFSLQTNRYSCILKLEIDDRNCGK